MSIEGLPGEAFFRSFLEGGDLLPLMHFKQALTKKLGVENGFAAYKQALDLPASMHLRLKPIESLREVAKSGYGAFFETAAGGERFVLPPPKVIGEGDCQPLEGTTRSMFVACLIDARIRGRSAFIEIGETAVLDHQGAELAQIDFFFDFDSAVFHASQEAAWIITPQDDANSIELEEAFTLVGPWAHYFGDWMLDQLPTYVAATLSRALPPIPVLIDAGMPPTHRRSLELMLSGNSEIIELPPFKIARVRRLWCAPSHKINSAFLETDRWKWNYTAISPARFEPVVDEIRRRADKALPPGDGPEKVFLARKESLHRRLINHTAIEAAAAARGFAIVYPEDLDFLGQVRLVRNARHIVAPDGSALFLGYFARPGTKLCILTHPLIFMMQTETALLSGVEVTLFTGPYIRKKVKSPEESDYQIDESRFCAFLEDWLKGG
jgi:capsular polysaccharide biosynthesis protein